MMNNFVFDHVFYTGSTAVGKIIYQMAASRPCSGNVGTGWKKPLRGGGGCRYKVAAKRIVMTKFSNAGQMCVAPDYVLVQQSVKEALKQR